MGRHAKITITQATAHDPDPGFIAAGQKSVSYFLLFLLTRFFNSVKIATRRRRRIPYMKLMRKYLATSQGPLTLFSILFLFLILSLTGCNNGDTSSGGATGDTSATQAVAGGGAPTGTINGNGTPVLYHHDAEIEKVHQAIQREGAQWIAGETSVSEHFANIQDAQVMDGDDGLEPEEASSAVEMKHDQPGSARATSFSWRNKDGKNWTTTPKNQGDYGTCVAFACIGAFETQIKIAKNDSSMGVALSEWSLWCEGTDKKNPKPGGWDDTPASKYLRDTGTVAETACPYTPADYLNFTPIPATVKRYKIGSYTWISGAAAMKTALEKGPLVGSMIVFPSFDNFYCGGVYQEVHTYDSNIDTYKDKNGQPVTGIHHAILIIGYDDEQSCWICKNSSGTGWGDNGYCLIKYGITGGIAGGGYQYTVDSSITYP
jgi:hypothetical protein